MYAHRALQKVSITLIPDMSNAYHLIMFPNVFVFIHLLTFYIVDSGQAERVKTWKSEVNHERFLSLSPSPSFLPSLQ